MKIKHTDMLMQNRVFLRIAMATGLMLLVPYLTMQFHWQLPDPGSFTPAGANWTLFDFIAAGILMFGTGSAYVLAARITPPRYRMLLGLVFMALLVYLWTELAVGVFTRWGS